MDRYQFDRRTLADMEASPVPFAVYQFIDRRVVTLALSAGFCELFGFTDRSEAYFVMDNDMYRDVDPRDTARIADAAVRFATDGGAYNVVYRSKTPANDGYTIIHTRGKHVYMPTGERLAYVWYSDEGSFSSEDGESTLRRAFCQALRDDERVRRNQYDALTGLPNMTYFFELADAGVKALRAAGRRPAILYVDLCGMKAFNNRWGFAEGDRLIREFGHLLAEQFSNESCGRFGQDHYAAFADADTLEAKLRRVFEGCARLNGERSLPARAGIYLVGEEDVEIGKACDRAKMACDLNRKAMVSDFYYFNEGMLADAEKRQYIVENLDRAMAEGWIKVYYQPIIRAANGRVCDEEALSRWIDPARGFLSPGDFIPALEEAGLIYKLDLYVVDRVLEKLKSQAEAGLYLAPQSVNLSRMDFDSCDIVEEIRRRVDGAGIDRSMLTIEITESVVGSDFEFIKAQVARFQALGFAVWMDDFGSGYSSLDVLQSIRFDLIKFDMRFMQNFDNGDAGKIILTELVKMAMGLGMETVCEGVERAEQVEFLREIGCTKLQGFYYGKPIPLERILERYREGKQIGLENPAETGYYAAVGGLNLYDASVISSDDDALKRYFDALPMAIVELKDETARFARCNRSWREFIKNTFGKTTFGVPTRYDKVLSGPGAPFMKAILQCARDGGRAVVDEVVAGGVAAHAFLRRIAVNPVNGAVAVALVVLAEEREGVGTTYAHIARALSADYINLYYVDLETERFIEYTSDITSQDLALERHGEDFFAASRRDARKYLHEDDREYFVSAFTRENVLRAIDEHGTFTVSYRLLMDGEAVYVSMKVVRMQSDPGHIIVGVSNVDAQMRQKEAMERIQAERITYARISALAGDYICIYTVNPNTDRYTEYSATREYRGLGLDRAGDDFFNRSRADSRRALYGEDVEQFNAMFTRENVLGEVERSGIFSLQYRLMIDGEPRYVNLKAAMVQEKDGPQLIVGINNVDARVRRVLDYERKLAAARNRVNLDGLTGVKNRAAFENMSRTLDQELEDGHDVHYAIALCGVVGLAEVNRTRGKSAGDELIREACAVICEVFKHSPVFRVSGDAFAVVAQGHDYESMEALIAALKAGNARQREAGGAVIACGVASYDGSESVASVFARAEARMRGKGMESRD